MSENRKCTVGLAPEQGTINRFYAFLNGKKIIAADGDKERKWSGNVSGPESRLKVRVTGIADAKYTLTIDLPGTDGDQSLTFSLQDGYHEVEIVL